MQIPGKCYSLCNHLTKSAMVSIWRFILNTCPNTIRTQNGVHTYLSCIEFKVYTRHTSYITVGEYFNSVKRQNNILMNFLDTVDLLATFTAWLEESPKGLAAPENVCRSLSFMLRYYKTLKYSCLRLEMSLSTRLSVTEFLKDWGGLGNRENLIREGWLRRGWQLRATWRHGMGRKWDTLFLLLLF